MRFRHTRFPSDSERGGIKLAPGVRLSKIKEQPDAAVLVFSGGKVQLNRSAVAILELCNGSRDREKLVAELQQRSAGSARTTDVAEFLDAAKARGWIIEA